MRKLLASIVALAVMASVGCTRGAHTRSNFGTASHTWFDRQAQSAAGAPAQGLDSEEAAIVHRRYKEGLGKRGTATSDPSSSVLILKEDGRERAMPR